MSRLPIASSRTLGCDGLGLAGARARPGSADQERLCEWSVGGGGLPQKRGQFASAGHGDDTGGLATLAVQALPLPVQALLGAPGDSAHAWVLAVLAALQGDPDAWLAAVVVGRFDQETAGVGGPGLGDGTLAAPAVAGVLAGHDPQIAGQLAGMAEAAERTDLGAQPRR
jgi:hypothetical protein